MENGRLGERAKAYNPGSDDAQTNFSFPGHCVKCMTPVHRDPEAGPSFTQRPV